jgi:hypothetical protein
LFAYENLIRYILTVLTGNLKNISGKVKTSVKIKIFGERNTGTNALKAAIELNSSSIVCPGTVTELSRAITYKLRLMKSLGFDDLSCERAIDAYFAGKAINEQWKHCATYFESQEIDGETHFIFMVRNPLSWLLSLYKNPYHMMLPEGVAFQTFCDTNWRLLGRDNLSLESCKPLELYQAKLKSYLSFFEILERVGARFTVFRFEDFVNDQIKCLESLRSALDKPLNHFSEYRQSTKNSDKSLEFYKAYYGKEKWKEEISEAFIDTHVLDDSLLEQFGY